jgi:hypothetical protein
MSKGFWIFLAAGLAVVGGLIFILFTATQGAHLRLEGKILKVRVLSLTGSAACVVVVDFRATNPSDVPFVVNAVTLHLEPGTGDAVDGRTASKRDIENIFRYELLGPKYNPVLTLRDRISPHQTLDLMTGARFELPESAINARKAIRIRIEDVDGAAAELAE